MKQNIEQRSGRYVMPEEYKAVMDLLADFEGRFGTFFDKESERYLENGRNYFYETSLRDVLFEATQSIRKVSSLLSDYGGRLIKDDYLQRMLGGPSDTNPTNM